MKQTVLSEKALGSAIKRARQNQNLNQAQAGYKVKIEQSTISSIENGAPGTRLETLFRLLAALNLEIVVQSKIKDTSGDW